MCGCVGSLTKAVMRDKQRFCCSMGVAVDDFCEGDLLQGLVSDVESGKDVLAIKGLYWDTWSCKVPIYRAVRGTY
jgi:hypothetical protein